MRVIVSPSVVAFATVVGCSGGTQLEAHFTVSERATEALARSSSGNARALPTDGRVSFTPASLRVPIRSMHVCEDVEPVPPPLMGFTCARGRDQIEIGATDGEVELIGVDGGADVLSFSADVQSLGTYRAVLVLFGADGESPYQRLSANPIVDGQSYAFTDLAMPMRAAGILVQLPTPLELKANEPAVVQLVFDVESPVYLVHDPSTPTAVTIPGAGDVAVDSDVLALLPYAGTSGATIEKYEVELVDDQLGPHTQSFLKVVAVSDPAGALMAIQWQTVFRAGFDYYGPRFQPGPIFAPRITRSGDTYAIDEDPALSVSPTGSQLAFPAFQLASHSGTLLYGGASYPYTATKR